MLTSATSSNLWSPSIQFASVKPLKYAACCELDDSGVEVIVKRLPELLTVELEYNRIGLKGVTTIVNGLSNIKGLELCTDIVM